VLNFLLDGPNFADVAYFLHKNWQLCRNSRYTYEKCEGGGHGDGEYDEEDGEAAPGAGAGGRQLLTQAAQPSSPSSLLQLTSAPATEQQSARKRLFLKYY
jgi:hypothetical protein